MRSEEEINEQLDAARKAMEKTTTNLSSGKLAALDFTGIAGTVGIIQTLEWVLGRSDNLDAYVSPLHRPLDDI